MILGISKKILNRIKKIVNGRILFSKLFENIRFCKRWKMKVLKDKP